jgi:hypothetical protein
MTIAIIGADLLFKRANELEVDISMSVKLFSGYVDSEVQDIIESDLSILFLGGIDSNGIERLPYKLGQKIDKSDILNVILDVEGVDSVDIETYTTKINSIEFLQSYTPKLNEYLGLGEIEFTQNQGAKVTPIRTYQKR